MGYIAVCMQRYVNLNFKLTNSSYKRPPRNRDGFNSLSILVVRSVL